MSDNRYIAKVHLNQVLQSREQKIEDYGVIDKDKLTEQGMEQLTGLSETQKELDTIESILSGEYKYSNEEFKEWGDSYLEVFGIQKEDLTESVVRVLSHKRTLDQAHILINNHDYSDSESMAMIKSDIACFAKTLDKYKNTVISTDNIDEVEIAYRMISSSCRKYLSTKSPTFTKGKLRYELVDNLWRSVIGEELIIANYRQSLMEGNEGKTLGQVFGMESTREVQKEAVEEEGPAEAELSKSSSKVSRFFERGFSFDDYFAKFTFKSMETKKVDDMLKKLGSFVPGQVQVEEIELMGKKVRLVQKSNNKLYIAEGGNFFELGNTAEGMISKIEENKLKNMELYGRDSVNELLDSYEAPSESKGEHVKIRTQLQALLSELSRTGRKEGEGLSANQLNNIRKEKLVGYLRDINMGVRTIADIEAEVLAYNKEHISVEGIMRLEMQEIDKRLREKNGIADEKEAELIKPEEGWTREEQLVKNMVADLIYTNETGKMQLSLNEPEAFVSEMLKKHSSALFAMFDPKNETLLPTVMKKMGLDGLNSDAGIKNYKVTNKLSDVVASSLVKITHLLKEVIGTGDMADEELFKQALERALSENELLKGSLSFVKDSVDAAVESATDILQENVRQMTDTIFSYSIEPEEVRGESELVKIRRQSSKSDQGQGKFLKTVLNNYFSAMPNLDKRAMLAAAMRFCKEVPPLEMQDQDVIDEIKRYKIAKYSHLFKDYVKNTRYDLVDQAEIDAVAEYRQEKQNLRICANLLGGLLRGAGPLLQKMMQGMPTESMPPEIIEALKDMKSNLPPIPEDQVNEAFSNMIQNSGNKVTRIEKVKSMGAATVGQAFLCRIYGPNIPKEGKEVVIKLLRPEAQIKMEREEKIILECAEKTDKAMALTYKGQLLTYKDELDLKKEAENIKAGKEAYKGKKEDVDTIDVLDDIPASSTALVLEKASGTTVDRYMDELRGYADEKLTPFYQKGVDAKGEAFVRKAISYEPGVTDLKKLSEVRRELNTKINEAIKRRDHLINLCSVWINQAVFDQSSAFYHGDLHSGNILIDDEKATFIDYGNVVKLKDDVDPDGDRQTMILRMMLAAAGSTVKDEGMDEDALELFYKSFNDILEMNNDEEFNKIYTDELKGKLKDTFREILKKGDASEAGYRISVCLLKAQEIGVKLPPAIANFSQGQIRLQNTIDEFNKSIDSLIEGIKVIDKLDYQRAITHMDPIMTMMGEASMNRYESTEVIFERFMNETREIPEEEFKKALLDNSKKADDFDTGERGFNKREEFKKKYIGSFSGIRKLSERDKKHCGMLDRAPGELSAKEKIMSYVDKYKEHPELKGTAAHEEDVLSLANDIMFGTAGSKSLGLIGGQLSLYKLFPRLLRSLRDDDIQEIIDIFDKIIPTAIKLDEDVMELFELQDQNKEENRDKIESMADDITRRYKVLREMTKKYSVFTLSTIDSFDSPVFSFDTYETELKAMFAEETDGMGAKLREQFNTIKSIVMKNPNAEKDKFKPLPEDDDAYQKAMKSFLEIHNKISTIHVQRYYDIMYKDAEEYSIKQQDFNSVMIDVMKTNLASDDGSMSVLKMLSFGFRFKNPGFLNKMRKYGGM